MSRQRWDESAYRQIYPMIFELDAYTGYKPNVIEAPNGDGKLDTAKRYAHVALKYEHKSARAQRILDGYLMAAHRLALDVAGALGVPAVYMPKLEYGALRVLEYPAGATSKEHTDFDLFSLVLWRSHPDLLRFDGTDETWRTPPQLKAARQLNPQLHIGEIGEIAGLGPATPHWVAASTETQYSLVYFAIPDWSVQLQLPRGMHRGTTVGEWLKERLARSRY